MIEFTVYGVHAKLWGGQIFGILMLGAYIILLWRAQYSRNNPIDLAGMLVWPGTGQTSLASVMGLGAFLCATWIIADMSMRGKLTEGYFTAYIGAFVVSKALTEASNAWRDRAPSPAATNTTQVIDKAAVVSSAPPPNPPPPVPPNQPAAPPVVTAIVRARKTPKPKGRRR